MTTETETKEEFSSFNYFDLAHIPSHTTVTIKAAGKSAALIKKITMDGDLENLFLVGFFVDGKPLVLKSEKCADYRYPDGDEKQAFQWILECVHNAVIHELDENFYVDGFRRFDPHGTSITERA